MTAAARMGAALVLAALAWLAPVQPGQAQARDGTFMAAACKSGLGCTCRISTVTVADWELAVGQEAPAGAEDMVLVFPARGQVFWTAQRPDQVDRAYGGRGQCVIELFDEDVPADGVWEFTQGATDMSRCPLLTSGAAAAAIPVDLGTGTGAASGRMEIRWGGRFDVRKYMHEVTHPNWHQLDPHTWEYRSPQLEMLPTQAESPVSIRVSWRSTLQSSTRIEGRFHYVSRMDIPGAEALAALANTNCEMTSIHSGRWTGPLPGERDPRRDRESEF